METPMNFLKVMVAAGLVAASTQAFAADITGARATFPFPIYSKWADAYKKETGNGLNYQSIGSGTGIKQIQAKTVQPTIAAFQAAASNADWAKAPGYYVILTDQPGEASWPITAATFILMHKEPVDKAASAEATKFFKWAFAKGDKMAEELDYIPMPDSVVKLIEKTWSADIKS